MIDEELRLQTIEKQTRKAIAEQNQRMRERRLKKRMQRPRSRRSKFKK